MVQSNVPDKPGGWDEAAADYETLAEPLTRQYARAALELTGNVRGKNVLDVASGTGALALSAARAGARVLATDFSRGMVERLTARLGADEFAGQGCEARVMDGQSLDLTDATFDAAFSIFGIMLFPDWSRGLRELARVVKPGGRGVVAVWSRPEGAGPWPAFFDALRRVAPDRVPPFPPAFTILSDPGKLAQVITSAGFQDVSVHTVGGTWVAPSADWVAGKIDRLYRQFPVYSSLTVSERAAVRDALRDGLCEVNGHGELRLASDAYVTVGRR